MTAANSNTYFSQPNESFSRLCDFIRNNYGINLTEAKFSLVSSRLSKRLRYTGKETLNEYCDYVFSKIGGEERGQLCDFLSTNKTYFFREQAHFQFFSILLSDWDGKREMNIWSAACSSGDELYTLSMLLHEHNEKSRVPIAYNLLGTDISQPMLRQARDGRYSESHLLGTSKSRINKFFTLNNDKNYPYNVVETLKENTEFRYFNFIKDFGMMHKQFDIIFCRNSLIYFNDETKNQVVENLISKLRPGGYLFVGHCEGMLCRAFPLAQVQTSVFQKL